MNPTLNLHGAWRYELDEQDKGLEEGWFGRNLEHNNFTIPGTTASNHVGNPVDIPRELTKEAVRCLREEYKYLGVAWYQTDFILGSEFEQGRIEFLIERVMFESMVWIDGIAIGKRDSLSTCHTYDITEYVEVGKSHTITIRIDNRDIHKIGPYPSAYTDETQTIWNGMIGRVEITGCDEVPIENVVIGLYANERRVFLEFDIGSVLQSTKAQIDVSIMDGKDTVVTYTTQYDLQARRKVVKLDFLLEEGVEYWDEFTPKLYDMKISITYLMDGVLVGGSWNQRIGFKEISTKDQVLYINGIKRFLRGNIDCCVYPITAYPPMDVESWKDICNTTKEYGLNHIRFHSWCPPEAAFQAADEVGVYLQVEGPVWMDNWTGYTVGCHEEHHTYLPEEAKRIVLSYSHHPSFCIFSNGNELNGDFDLLDRIIKEVREKNPYIIYTLTTNWDRKLYPNDDIYIAQSVDDVGIRGQYFLDRLVEGTTLCYNDSVPKRSVPTMSHEVGQYVVYPNVEEIPRYTGVLKAVNLESIKLDLDSKNLTSNIPDYVMASGRLSALLYKAELEAALRTENFSGIQLLGLHDFPGQSTATIGLLDCFYQSKGILTPKEFREFCDSTVLLLNMPKLRYMTDEEFEFELQIAHYGNEELKDVKVEVSLESTSDDNKEIFWSSTYSLERITIGLNKGLGVFKGKIFNNLKGRNEFILTARMKSKRIASSTEHTDSTEHTHSTELTDATELADSTKFTDATELAYSTHFTNSLEVSNSWNIWVYEDEKEVTFPNSYEELNDDAVAQLEAGENIIIFAKKDRIKQVGPGAFFPVFWSPVHFVSKDPCGMIIRNNHLFFHKYYPVKKYADTEWKNLLENSFSINVDHLVNFEPMTMPVPNFFNNHKYTNLFEANVLNGKVIVCSLDLDSKADNFPEIKSFKKALKDYYLSEDFCPTQEINRSQLQEIFAEKTDAIANKVNIALNKPSFADSVKSDNYDASKGNDGNPLTYWLAADEEVGHSFTVDLQGYYDVKGTKVIFNEEGTILYVIHTSINGSEWNLAINQTGQTRKDKEREDIFEARARYVRITYNGLPVGVCAGHQEFEVYV
jgi:hypothetical protein